MFKKVVAISLLALSSMTHANCLVTSTSAPAVKTAILNTNWDGWNFPHYEVVCEKLNRANARLLIKGLATVLNGSAVSYVVINLGDKSTQITTSLYSTNVVVDKDPSMTAAHEGLVKAMNAAFSNFEIDAAIAELNTARLVLKKR